MAAGFYLQLAAQRAMDIVYAILPRRRPSRAALRDCKIVAHRGAHDRRGRRENTLAAFDAALDAGVWGIEFDVRWTRDYIPVVIHDPNCRRVFGVDLDIATTDFDELRRRVPELPALAEVVARYACRAHMMIELKSDALPELERKRERLREVFSELEPVRDFHVLALDPELFAAVDFIGERACIAVAELNPRAISRAALARDFAAIGGHYLLLNDRLIRPHRARGQKIGTGFITSRFCFYRELNRGIDWIFTNQAPRLAALRRRLLADE